MVRERRIHTIPVGLTERAHGVNGPYGVGVLWYSLLGLGLLTGSGRLGNLRLTRVHTTMGRPWQSSITAGGTLTSNTLTRGLTGGL